MKKEMLVIEENAFYEIDLYCIEKKKASQNPPDSRTAAKEAPPHPVKRQRK